MNEWKKKKKKGKKQKLGLVKYLGASEDSEESSNEQQLHLSQISPSLSQNLIEFVGFRHLVFLDRSVPLSLSLSTLNARGCDRVLDVRVQCVGPTACL